MQLTPARPAAFNAQGMRAERERAGLTLWELRNLTGIPRPELQAYESGTRQPRPHRLVTVAWALDVRPLALMNKDVIGRGLASLRVSAGLCQQELAISAGISTVTLRSLEGGTASRLDWATARLIARALRTSPETVRRAHNWDVNTGRSRK
jgi:transcriptional regulator with XRE-family HTH domain